MYDSSYTVRETNLWLSVIIIQLLPKRSAEKQDIFAVLS